MVAAILVVVIAVDREALPELLAQLSVCGWVVGDGWRWNARRAGIGARPGGVEDWSGRWQFESCIGIVYK